MATVRVSPKFQVVIPKEVRESMGLKAGHKLHVFRYENRIELVPAEPIRKLRGFVRGIDASVPRERDRV